MMEDTAEVTECPVIPLSKVGQSWRSELGRSNVVMGVGHYRSEKDLSTTISLQREESGIAVEVAVVDDVITTSDQPSQDASYDCVELLWDLRSEELQGTPWWGRDVYLLRITPPRDVKSQGRWDLISIPTSSNPSVQAQCKEVSELKKCLAVECQRTAAPAASGYLCEVKLANPFFTTKNGALLRHVGFNLVVVDNDGTNRRQKLMTLAGGLDVYSSTQQFPLLWLSDDPLPERPVVVRSW